MSSNLQYKLCMLEGHDRESWRPSIHVSSPKTLFVTQVPECGPDCVPTVPKRSGLCKPIAPLGGHGSNLNWHGLRFPLEERGAGWQGRGSVEDKGGGARAPPGPGVCGRGRSSP